MVFSSPVFIFMFLPLVLTIYYLLPSKYKNLLLTIASLYFYAFGEKFMVILIILSTLINFYCGILIERGKAKLGLRLAIFYNLLTLGFFKYFNFTFENFNSLLTFVNIKSDYLINIPKIALPIGISFFTFECLSYVIDVYRKEVKANKNFLEFITFVTLFPHLIAGPVIRYVDLQIQLERKDLSYFNFKIGLERFIIGLAKKMIIANTFAKIADEVFKHNIDDLSTSFAWIGIISYTIQIYFDFSGYSDMAIGLAKMFGFNFLENFNYPYISKSIKEFWRRWHISLSSWFRDYLYISLGGNKISKSRTYLNLFIVFFATGLWHGASWNFVVWGLFHGFFIVFERIGFDKILTKFWTPIQHFYTLLIVIIGWVFFRSDNLESAVLFIKKMFIYSDGDEYLNSYLTYFNINNELYFTFFMALLFSLPSYKYFDSFLSKKNTTILRPIIFILLLFISITYLASGTYNPFIYYKF
jgi:alginate O-acetyltransferase complex protein AlgI